MSCSILNWSIIIFCYNEEGNIQNVFEDAYSLLTGIADKFEIVIIDDGSTDNTHAICRSIAQKHGFVKLIGHEVNLGIGMALKSGYQAATGDYLCAIPGDGQFDLNELKHVTEFPVSAYYSFYRPKTDYNLYRQMLTWANRLFNQHALGIYLRDVNWIKVYKKEYLQITQPKLNSSLIESEICAKLYKCNILPVEIPSKYLKREHGISRGGSIKTLFKAVRDMIPLWWIIIRFKPSQRF